MGVALLSCITRKETTKAGTICCCSRSLCRRQVREVRSVVESPPAAYSNTTATPHEYFCHTSFDRTLVLLAGDTDWPYRAEGGRWLQT